MAALPYGSLSSLATFRGGSLFYMAALVSGSLDAVAPFCGSLLNRAYYLKLFSFPYGRSRILEEKKVSIIVIS